MTLYIVFIIIIVIVASICWRQKRKYHIKGRTDLSDGIRLHEHQYEYEDNLKEEALKKVNIRGNVEADDELLYDQLDEDILEKPMIYSTTT